MKRPKRRPRRSSFTVLPGGARLTFEGYLPSKACPECGHVWPAAAYVKTLYTENKRRWLRFGSWCWQCDPPADIPIALNGVRPTSTYTDAADRIVGWQQRDRRRGHFGPMLRLELLGLRKTADGVWRPQPKLDRRSAHEQAARPLKDHKYRTVADHRRCYSVDELDDAIVRQRGLCAACRRPFTKRDPAVGDHAIPYADGGATRPDNCLALHDSCNKKKGRRTMREYQREQQWRAGDLFGAAK